MLLQPKPSMHPRSSANPSGSAMEQAAAARRSHNRAASLARTSLFGLVILASTLVTIPASAASVVDQLAGRWSGWGSVKMTNGTTEQVKCVATFFVKNASSDVRQNLRCASASYKIDVRSDLNVKGRRISGRWEERNHSNSGNVSGSINGSTFKMAITGPVLNADMTLATSPCKMNISIRPRDYNVGDISIGLRKC
ncbi:MAG: hypothetical protein AAGG72_06635 [Pseudomonadota bacterium]